MKNKNENQENMASQFEHTDDMLVWQAQDLMNKLMEKAPQNQVPAEFLDENGEQIIFTLENYVEMFCNDDLSSAAV